MKILVIDDEFAALTKMKTLLSDYGECSLAESAGQALQLFSEAVRDKAPYDLITIDIGLPEINGLELLTEIIELEKRWKTPPAKKIMVTASGTKENLLVATAKGCQNFIVKPVKRDILDKKMRDLGFNPNVA